MKSLCMNDLPTEHPSHCDDSEVSRELGRYQNAVYNIINGDEPIQKHAIIGRAMI